MLINKDNFSKLKMGDIVIILQSLIISSATIIRLTSRKIPSNCKGDMFYMTDMQIRQVDPFNIKGMNFLYLSDICNGDVKAILCDAEEAYKLFDTSYLALEQDYEKLDH